MTMFKPGTRVKVVRHLVGSDGVNMVGEVGTVVAPLRPYTYPVVVAIDGWRSFSRHPGEESWLSFLEAELEPLEFMKGLVEKEELVEA